jgi:hypothetical protein
VAQHGGMSLHAEVAVPARDRCRLERLCRYVYVGRTFRTRDGFC